MAYSTDDHVLDHIVLNSDIPYICYKIKKNKFYIDNINLDTINVQDTNAIVYDIICKYMNIFNKIKNDLAFLNINGISLDIRVNNGYDLVLCQVVLVTSKTNDKMNCTRGSKFDLLLICLNRIQ